MTDTAMSGKNRHIVDQLADVRAQIKELTEREGELKARVSQQMGSADSLGGDQYIASQSLQERKGGLDEAAMSAAGIEIEKYRKPKSTFVVIKTEARVMEVA